MRADLVIRSSRIIDGTGAPSFAGGIAISDGRIAAIGPSVDLRADDELDARDLVVTPGFIDMHVHADLRILVDSSWRSSLDQGVTTIVIGQDGLGLAPLNDVAMAVRRQLRGINGDPDVTPWSWRTVAEYLARIESEPLGPNVATMVSHGTIRLVAMGEATRPPSPSELAHMQALVRQGMEDGGFGLSAGLTYAPASFATNEELVALCMVAGRYGGFYQPHHRNYGAGAIREYAASIEIGRQAGVPVHLTHAHLSFSVNANRAPELLAQVDAARLAGLDVTMDSYPYLAGSTYLAAFLPSWAQVDGTAAVVSRLHSPETRARIAAEMDAGSDGLQGVPVEWAAITIAGVNRGELAGAVGQSIEGLGRVWSMNPFDAFAKLLIEDDLAPVAILTIGHEDNVRAILAHPAQMPASDGIDVGQRPHPRAWGTFARSLGRYSRELGVVKLEEMVRKMTSAPARRLGLADRGVLRTGAAADVTVLDPDVIIDRATYEEPRQAPVGVHSVIVNGTIVVRDGRAVEASGGRVLRRPTS